MRRIVFVFVLFTGVYAIAQDNNRAFGFFSGQGECANSLGGWKCLELDLSSELAEEPDSTKHYEYSWTFGDGNRVQGSKIEHCYESFGNYQVMMDLLDLESRTVIRNELSSVLYLYPEIHPLIDIDRDGQLPTYVKLSFNYNESVDFSPDRVYWRIDGGYYEGSSVVHSFPVAGVYLIEMGVEKDMGFLGTVAACATREVSITQSDVWTTGIHTAVQEAKRTTRSGPYTEGEVFCLVREIASGKETAVVPVNLLMQQSLIQEGAEYELIGFSGNVFTGVRSFSTKGLQRSEMYVALRDTVSALFTETPLNKLPTVSFNNNSAKPDTVAVRRLAELLMANSSLKVEVGAYLHTGSRFSKGVATSIARSSRVKEQLTRYGVSSERISIASPEYNRSLVNTCSALDGCDWEDPELDGKVECRITGSI